MLAIAGLYELLKGRLPPKAEHTVKARSASLIVLEIPIKPLCEFFSKYEGVNAKLEGVLESLMEHESDPTVKALDMCPDLRSILEVQDCKYAFRQQMKPATFPPKHTMQSALRLHPCTHTKA